MDCFIEISASEQTLVFGGKDAVGYGIGALVRAIKILIQNRQNPQNIPVEILKMYAR